jgi:phosphoribosyl-AMP cyclohydrolase
MHTEPQSPSNVRMRVYMREKTIDMIMENREDTYQKEKRKKAKIIGKIQIKHEDACLLCFQSLLLS